MDTLTQRKETKMEYDEKSARLRVTRNGGKFKGKGIIIKRAGIKVLGAIDYLINKHKYFRSGEEK
jgi:YD repeat-containing protein